MFEDNGAGIAEELQEEMEIYLKQKLLSRPRVFVYAPGEDTSGLDDEDRQLFGITEDKAGWRIKVLVPAHRYVIPGKAGTMKPYPEFPVDNNQYVDVPDVLIKAPLKYNDTIHVEQETVDLVLALLREQGVKILE